MNLAQVMTEASKFCEVKKYRKPQDIQFVMPNGLVVAASYDSGSYCSNRFENGPFSTEETYTVELLCWKANGRLYRPRTFGFEKSGVRGWMPCDELLDFLKVVRRRNSKGAK